MKYSKEVKMIIKGLKEMVFDPKDMTNCTPLPSGYNVIFDRTGSTHSEEWKKNHCLALKGKPLSESHKQKLRESKQRFYANGGVNHNKGTKLSDEHKAKIKANHKGMKGRNHSEESRKLMSEKAKLRGNYKGKWIKK